MEFMSSEVFMAILEFPIARKIAAPALYMAIIGMEDRTISR